MKDWPPFPVRQGLLDRAALICLHLALLWVLDRSVGWELNSAAYLAESTQFLSLRELADHLGRSLLHLISQPPLYNLAIGLSLKLSPQNFTSWLFGWHIVMSVVGVWAIYGLARLLSGRRWPALALAAWLPAAPDWLLYESWSNYTFPVMTLALVLVYLACRFRRTGDLPTLLGLAACLNLILLTRSLYHLAFGLVFCAAMLLFHPSARKRLAVGLLLPTLVLTGGWYAKNLVMFGFFGTTSWTNLNLMRVVAHGRPPDFVRKTLEGTPQAYLYEVWRVCPGMFCDLVDHYLHALDHPMKGDSPVLHDLFEENLDGTRLHRNMNNINYLTINQDAGAAVRRLIEADPAGYLGNVAQAFRHFINPPTKYGFLEANRKKIEGYTSRWERIVYFKLPWWGGPAPWLTFLYPLIFLYFLYSVVRAAWSRGRSEPAFDDLACTGVILYVALASIMAELGENHRFSFLILPLLWTWLAGRAAGLILGRADR